MPEELLEFLDYLHKVVVADARSTQNTIRQTTNNSMFGPDPVDVSNWMADWSKI